MRNVMVFFFVFVLSGCSFQSLLLLGEIDKVHVVRHTTYLKSYRAYFQRADLKPIRQGRKYLYFYNRKHHDFALLLHTRTHYLLYSFSHPGNVIKIRSDRKHGYAFMIRSLKHRGYHITMPHTVGVIVNISLKRYKKVKTYCVEVKDYQRLQSLYQKAIRTYRADIIKSIRTKLPKSLILTYYRTYKAKAKTEEQQEALNVIASKLGLDDHTSTAKMAPEETETLYRHYLTRADYHTLHHYLMGTTAKERLSPQQYATLKQRDKKLEEEKLLQEGSLEALITAYKKNNNPRYKTKIMQRIKELQQKN